MQFPMMEIDRIRRPIIPVMIESLAGRRLIVDALVDTGSDITLFPEAFAAELGIDLTSAHEEPLSSGLGVVAHYRAADVVLELRRGISDRLRWPATVGFLSRKMVYSILGTKGFFESLVLHYDAAAGQIEIVPNKSTGVGVPQPTS